jgi:hypothetical protein
MRRGVYSLAAFISNLLQRTHFVHLHSDVVTRSLDLASLSVQLRRTTLMSCVHVAGVCFRRIMLGLKSLDGLT